MVYIVNKILIRELSMFNFFVILFSRLFLVTVVFIGIGCNAPSEPDGNLMDPQSSNYSPSPPLIYAYATRTNSIQLSWDDRSLAEDGFQVVRREATTTFLEVARVAANSYLYLDSSPTLVHGQVYYYRVRAFSGIRYGEYSNEVAVRLP